MTRMMMAMRKIAGISLVILKNLDVILLESLAKFVSNFLQRKWYIVKSKTNNNFSINQVSKPK